VLIRTVLRCGMPTSEQYRKSADQCRRAAQSTNDKLEREALLRIAEQWGRLADHKAESSAQAAWASH
jgi:hypothetical protein